MHKTLVFRSTYFDSVTLMLASQAANELAGIEAAFGFMATPLNISLAQSQGLVVESGLTPDDLVVAARADSEEAVDRALKLIDSRLRSGSSARTGDARDEMFPSARIAARTYSEAKLAFISVPGDAAAYECAHALEAGLNVFCFSDGVSTVAERTLKKFALQGNLLLMGPDCGTSILDGYGLGFANVISEGPVSIVGASGTGMQELTCLLDSAGIGISQAIGVGGRDLTREVGGLMTLRALELLNNDAGAEIVVVISKSPDPSVAEEIAHSASDMEKPCILCFIGAPDEELHRIPRVGTIERCAQKVCRLLGWPRKSQETSRIPPTPGFIRGLFSGGTLCEEALTVAARQIHGELYSNVHVAGVAVGDANQDVGHLFLDLGQDEFTQGRLHPMIDPSLRLEHLKKEAGDPHTGVLLMDIVLGHGAHPDPASVFAPAIEEALTRKTDELTVIVSLCGSRADPQDVEKQRRRFLDAGAHVCRGTAFATRLALAAAGLESKPIASYFDFDEYEPHRTTSSGENRPLISPALETINVGAEVFGQALENQKVTAKYVDWQRASIHQTSLLASLAESASDVMTANDEAVGRMQRARPVVAGVGIARDVIDDLDEATFLHAGPPIEWSDMCGPLRGAIIGAALFEGLATNPEDAEKQAARGAYRFLPCHERSAVGPMAGVVSASMPVWIVENKTAGNRAFSTFNEGLGKVLRYGAFDDEVLNGLHWIRDVLYPLLSSCLSILDEPLDLRALMAQAIQMGDECHNRNRAGTSLLLRSLLRALLSVDHPRAHILEVAGFINGNDHFFLNLAMAGAKTIVDPACGVTGSSIVVAMARNGTEFGIRLAGTGREWFLGPAGLVEGLYLPGFGPGDANPDIGDSTIMETVGLGGFAMAAAPTIVGFVGGSPEEATRATDEMYAITWSESEHFRIPGLGFRGSPFGIDAREVIHTQILPFINTGIAHKTAGVGQVGAGLVRPPVQPFSEALARLVAKVRR